MDNKRIVFIKLIKNCKPNHSLISSPAWAGLIIIAANATSQLSSCSYNTLQFRVISICAK